jgi:hypothetical protein
VEALTEAAPHVEAQVFGAMCARLNGLVAGLLVGRSTWGLSGGYGQSTRGSAITGNSTIVPGMATMPTTAQNREKRSFLIVESCHNLEKVTTDVRTL